MAKLILISFILSISFSAAATTDKHQKEYKFGVFPYLPTNRIKKVYTPIAKHLSETIGASVKLRTKSTFAAFQESLYAEEYDIAFVQPFDYIVAHDKYNYLPLVRRNHPLRTVIIVKKGSPYKRLNQLKGKVVTTPPAHSAVSRLTNKSLKQNGLNLKTDITRTYKKNHFACLQSVLIGEAAACGTTERVLKHFSDIKMKDKFTILYKAQEIPHSLFVIHKRIPQEIREKLIKSMVDWPNTKNGRKILAGKLIVPMLPTNDSLYDVIR